ncbi:UbiA family prenyltransferase [Nitrospira moscoviensis]|uniref:Prenyltransferase, UbiA family n=1 Tax=Nitrospira moscoviensis TaxID=42253 RepID=A0A0K2GDP8_NITMO|nr:UbiA family prenyltransferase [Nitrospira moscoviensis]ALA59073.1 prenyltransferase, UbiA family [Nitrospira moscoviensis]
MHVVGSQALKYPPPVCPLVVDLDGTLIRTDTLHEGLCGLFRTNPASLCLLPYWLWRGKARLKQQLAARTTVDPRILPFNRDFLAWLHQQRAHGRTLILCTASDQAVATAIAEHLGVFDEVMASDGTVNLAGPHKAEALVQRFGPAGFDYAGNSRADLSVWQWARRAIVVGSATAMAKHAALSGKVERVFPSPAWDFTTWRRVLRLHQWLKNLLLGVPAVAAHQIADPGTWLAIVLAFISFSLCASAVYVTNDLLDLDSDRKHPHKVNRPFASGLVPVWAGFALAPLLLLGSVAVARHVGGAFLPWLAVYAAMTAAYSWGLKRLILIDCLILAMLYTLRIVAGAAVTGIELSFWLLAFSGFVFLSLAFAKRYAELRILSHQGEEQAHGRGYRVSDAPLVQMLGVTSGYAAVVVFALYLNSEAVLRLYRAPQFLWAAVPIMVFWISWMWMQAHRGHLREDAVVFAVTDRASLLAGAALACVVTLATVSWP